MRDGHDEGAIGGHARLPPPQPTANPAPEPQPPSSPLDRLQQAAAARLALLQRRAAQSPAIHARAACQERAAALQSLLGPALTGSAYLRLRREAALEERALHGAETTLRETDRATRGALHEALADLMTAAPEPLSPADRAGLRRLADEAPVDARLPERLAALRGLLRLRHIAVPRLLGLPRPWSRPPP